MKNKAVIFDFDGTIADSEGVMVKIYQYYAAQNNRPKLTLKTTKLLRDGSTRQAIKWAGIKFWQIPGLLKLARAEYSKSAEEIKIFPGIEKLINQLIAEYDVYVLSTNSDKTVKYIMKRNDFKPKVTILKGSTLFGKGKVLRRLVRSNKYDPSQSWMIGDEIRDIEAGDFAKLKTIGVTWGLQSRTGLKLAGPDHIVSNIDQLEKILLK